MRLKIAQDLHDEIGSTLSSVSFNIHSIQRQLNGSETGVKKLLETITATSATAIRTLNDIVWAINPEKDDSVSLSKRMNQFALELCQAREIQLIYDEGPDFKNTRLSVDVRKSFYLIFKEVVNNAVKHSKCTEIKVSLLSSPHVVEMVIADNGNGFETTLETEGNGLKNIRERSKEIHSELNITSSLGKGTTISLKSRV
jgi:signal transduction histidine kinase